MKSFKKRALTLALAVFAVSSLSGCYLLDGRAWRAKYNNYGDKAEDFQKDVERYFFNYEYDSPHDNY